MTDQSDMREAAKEALSLIDQHIPLTTRSFSSRRHLQAVVALLEAAALSREPVVPAAGDAGRRRGEPPDMRRLRWLLANSFAAQVDGMLYTDDGEYSESSGHPSIDFRRDSVADIEAAMQRRFENIRSNKP